MSEETLDGELWSAIRTLLEQGAAIQQDYAAGKYPSYEHYSARLDDAARERIDWVKSRAWNRRAGDWNAAIDKCLEIVEEYFSPSQSVEYRNEIRALKHQSPDKEGKL